MEKPHTKVYKKIRKVIEDGEQELKNVEAPSQVIDRLNKLKTEADVQELLTDKDFGR
jgi:hypothetical protein